jgi:FG-GAP repeat protein
MRVSRRTWSALCALAVMAIAIPSGWAQTDVPVTQAHLTIRGPNTAATSFFGQPLAGGDLDGDGFDEIITAASDGTDGYIDRVFIFRGGADFISSRVISSETIDLGLTVADLEIVAENDDDQMPSAIGVGDINGDTIADLFLSAPFHDGLGRGNSGVVYGIFGGPDLFSTSEITLGPSGGWDVRFIGAVAGDFLGAGGPAIFPFFDAPCIAVGNLNGDTFGDLVIGNHAGFNTGGFGPDGQVFIIFGEDFTSGTTFDLATTGATGRDVRITAPADGDEMGQALAVADITGDGLDDLIIGAAWHSPSLSVYSSGQAHVLRGRTTWSSSIALASTPADVTISGVDSYDYVGEVVFTGDFDGDGTQDLAVGAPEDTYNLHVYFGGTRFAPGAPSAFNIGSTPGDVRVVGAGGLGANPSAGADVDGDGRDELILPRRDFDTQLGATDIILGRARGSFQAIYDLDSNEFDFQIKGVDTRDTAGSWAAAADTDGVNGAEVLVGSSFASDEEGAVWVFDLPLPEPPTATDFRAWESYLRGSATRP